MRTVRKEAERDSRRSGWSWPRSGHDQSAGQTMSLSAGEEGGAVLPQAKKRRPHAVARAAGFHLRQQVKEGKRDSRRSGWSWPCSGHDQNAGQTMPLSAAGFRLRQQVKEGKRDS